MEPNDHERQGDAAHGQPGGRPYGSFACEGCGRRVELAGKPRLETSRAAKTVYVLAGVVGAAWFAGVLLWSPDFLVGTGVVGLAAMALFYFGPGIGIGIVAWRLPRVQRYSCGACGWSTTMSPRQGYYFVSRARNEG